MNFCEDHSIPVAFGYPQVRSTVFLPEYGNVSTKRLKEMERRVMLPDHDKDGGYWVGRKMENGKIADKMPDLSK